MVKKITEKEFVEVGTKKMALIDFSATWCGPCKMLAPILESVSEEMGDRVSFYNIDVDECPELAQKYGVSSIPTLILLKDGKKVDMQVGFQPKNQITHFIESKI